MRIIKKYKNRKLYDTESHKYITLEEIAILACLKHDLRVKDLNGEDITLETLGQAICTNKEQTEAINKMYEIFEILKG